MAAIVKAERIGISHQLQIPVMATDSSPRIFVRILAALDQTAHTPSSRQLNTSHLGILFSNEFAFVISDLLCAHLANGYAI